MRLKQQYLDGRCPGTKGTHALMHVYTKIFTVTASSASRVILS